MNISEIEGVEVSLLIEAMFQRYGYDFRSYARASIERRVRQFLPRSGCATISEMISKLIHDPLFFQTMVREFSITVTEMFRDPKVYRTIRECVVPVLKTYPFIKVWHAGCATGEEVYSMAILLKEEGLYERSTIYATDFNDEALATARDGIFSIENVKNFTTSYQESGGTVSFSEYYHSNEDSIVINKGLKENITFANHNLVTDNVFSEMHLILCRNVLIYFDRNLQNRVFNLFNDSLINDGFLCIGTKEALNFSDVSKIFIPVNERMKIYKKKTSELITL